MAGYDWSVLKGRSFFELSEEERQRVIAPVKEIRDLVADFNKSFPAGGAPGAVFPRWLRTDAEEFDLEAFRRSLNETLG